MDSIAPALSAALSNFSAKTPAAKAERVVAVAAVAYALNRVRKNGVKKTFGMLVQGLLDSVPGAKALVQGEIAKEVDTAVENMFNSTEEADSVQVFKAVPKVGLDKRVVLAMMDKLKTLNTDPKSGKMFAYVYKIVEEQVKQNDDDTELDFNTFVEKAFCKFLHENALNPVMFPALRRFENEVVAMALNMMHGHEAGVGTLTCGGTESILCAIKAYRDRAKELKGITAPEMVICISAHPAFQKAAHYFGVKCVNTPVRDDMRMDVDAARKAISSNTICVIGSACSYPHGVIDPIEELAAVAKDADVPMHVDACVGGFLLPWMAKIGYELPKWDFSVDGVTSISADIHKYGYCPKGASVVLYKDASYRKYQYYAYGGWNGGLFVSPSMTGSRGGGSIAAAWATMLALGENGYCDLARNIMTTSKYMQETIGGLEGFEIVSKPDMSIVAFKASDDTNVFAIADVMEDEFGWKIERQTLPDCIHMSLMPAHSKIKEKFVADLQKARKNVRENPDREGKGSAAMYGMVANIPSEGIVDGFLVEFMSKVFTPEK